MSDKELVSLRLETDTKRRIERYAEKHDVSRSTAMRRLLEKGADLEEAGLTVAASRSSRSEEEEKEVMADGGQVVRPMFNFMGAFYAFLSLSIFGVMALAAFDILRFTFLNYGELFGVMMSSLLLVALVMILLYSDYPEKADQLLYSGVRKASGFKPSILGSKS